MIRLEVQDYCHSCPYFEEEVDKPVAVYADSWRDPDIFGDTVITCRNKKICERVHKVTTESLKDEK